MMDHWPDDRRFDDLSRYHDGEFEPTGSEALREALEDDREAAHFVRRLANLDLTIGSGITNTDLRLRVRAAIAADQRSERWSRLAIAASLMGGIALGAVLGLAAEPVRDAEPRPDQQVAVHLLAPGAAWGPVNRLAAEIEGGAR